MKTKSKKAFCTTGACHTAHTVETISHAFFSCPEVQPAVTWFFNLWDTLHPSHCPPRTVEVLLADDPRGFFFRVGTNYSQVGTKRKETRKGNRRTRQNKQTNRSQRRKTSPSSPTPPTSDAGAMTIQRADVLQTPGPPHPRELCGGPGVATAMSPAPLFFFFF